LKAVQAPGIFRVYAINMGISRDRSQTANKRQYPTPSPATASVKHLFAFTKRQHAGTLSTAIVAAIVTGGLKTTLAVVLGKIFEVIAQFGAGMLEDRQALSQVSTWCVVLCALGGGVWLSNASFLALWITFGELQAKSVRNLVFGSVLGKEMAWFDTQSNGIASLLVRIET
jgi:ATP-binding cassette, subfamily B (MDR/TAP), member 1